MLTERREDFSNGEVALSTNVLVRGGVLWSKIVFCYFIGDVCACGETNAVTADVCAQNHFGVDVLGPCMAKVESVLMSCSNTPLLSASQSASETVALLFPTSFGFVGLPPFVWLKKQNKKKLGTHRALICRYERTKFTPNAGRLIYVLICCLQSKV